MKIATLLLEAFTTDDGAHCDRTCPDLDGSHPCKCMRFPGPWLNQCMPLDRDADGRPVRCDACLAAQSAVDRILEPIAEAVNLLEIVEGGAQTDIPGRTSFVVRDEDRNRMLDFVKRWRKA